MEKGSGVWRIEQSGSTVPGIGLVLGEGMDARGVVCCQGGVGLVKGLLALTDLGEGGSCRVMEGEFRGSVMKTDQEFTLVIEETHDGSSNHIFKAAMEYLDSHLLSVSSAQDSPKRLTVGKSENIRKFTFGLDTHSKMVDCFHGVPLKWKFNADVNTTNINQQHTSKSRWYELSFQKNHAEMVKSKYIPHVIDMVKKLKDQNRIVKFHTIMRERWSSNAVKLDHPMTFDTLALDGDLKNTIMEDLDSFINVKEYYKKIGKVWKRSYLLHGPPGTGKSSLIAAMANHVNFDIYSMNLSIVNFDSSLEYLLLHVSNHSILVIEDIDCTIKLQNREAGEQLVSLSGFLNAIDGLFSCCGDERIIVFTTNYKDKIDPALLRADRMDKNICLSYCTALLSSNWQPII
ncbi:hypothetical protein V6N11_076874 [Hibiscus sabdariffa]|uniref:AAA+ ATPase domain-containing protein n=1 Tax=Hibiscus sabdariffa TaxID=183260 RepID=A0ABR2TBR2_9ROSI